MKRAMWTIALFVLGLLIGVFLSPLIKGLLSAPIGFVVYLG